MPEAIKRDLIDFAHPPVIISSARMSSDRSGDQPLATPKGFIAVSEGQSVRFCWDNDYSSEAHYRVYCGTRSGCYDAVYPAVGNSLTVVHYRNDQPFVMGQRYVATIEKISACGRTSIRAPEIQFTLKTLEAKRAEVPLGLELKVLWASLQTVLPSFRLSL